MTEVALQMPIGEVAERAGMSTSRIRFYEARGLLPEPERAGGKRRYGEEVLRRLAIIDAAQRVGFTLEEIRDLLGSRDELAHERLRAARGAEAARARRSDRSGDLGAAGAEDLQPVQLRLDRRVPHVRRAPAPAPRSHRHERGESLPARIDHRLTSTLVEVQCCAFTPKPDPARRASWHDLRDRRAVYRNEGSLVR